MTNQSAMVDLSPVLAVQESDGPFGSTTTMFINCPGCQMWHLLYTKSTTAAVPLWSWDGNADNPTFSPSLMVNYQWWGAGKLENRVCHSFIREGRIQFLSDCTHALAGQTVDLPAIDCAFT